MHVKPGTGFQHIVGKHNRLNEIPGTITTAISSLIGKISLILRQFEFIPKKKNHPEKGSRNTIKLHVCMSSEWCGGQVRKVGLKISSEGFCEKNAGAT